jgi:hypothetical protein
MSTQKEFPDLIKAGLKVGDTVYSYQEKSEGVVIEIDLSATYPIAVEFGDFIEDFDEYGFYRKKNIVPSLTLTPWNPIAGEAFPFPKFEPIVGEVYAFWDRVSGEFKVSRYKCPAMKGHPAYRYENENNEVFINCAPLAEAMHIFGFDKPQQP